MTDIVNFTDEQKESLTSIFEDVLRKLFGDVVQEDNTTPMTPEAAELKREREGEPLQSYSFYDDPIPVTITNPSDVQITKERPAIGWTSQKAAVYPSGKGTTQGPQLIVGFNKRRTSVSITNKGSNSVAIAPSNNVRFNAGNPNGNFELAANDAIVIDTCAEVWAVADPTTPTFVELHIIELIEEGTPS